MGGPCFLRACGDRNRAQGRCETERWSAVPVLPFEYVHQEVSWNRFRPAGQDKGWGTPKSSARQPGCATYPVSRLLLDRTSSADPVTLFVPPNICIFGVSVHTLASCNCYCVQVSSCLSGTVHSRECCNWYISVNVLYACFGARGVESLLDRDKIQ